MTDCGKYAELDLIFTQVEDCAVDCNEMSMIISSLLKYMGIKHNVILGFVEHLPSKSVISPHVWINLSNGIKVDYRLRRWLGDVDEIPHGVFRSGQYLEEVDYKPIKELNNNFTSSELSDISEGYLDNICIGVLDSVKRRYQDSDLISTGTIGCCLR